MAIDNDDVPKDTDLLSQRSEVFRSKLIADFHLLETITEGGRRLDVPRYYTHDVMDPGKMAKMMLHRPQGLVRFQVYTNKEEKQLKSVGDRRRNRVRNKNTKNPPLDLWASWVVNSAFFQNSILALILLNSVVLGIQAELSDYKDSYFDTTKFVLDIFDYCALIVFVAEIILKWLDNFWEFWKNRWNIFDFFVTFLSLVPEIMKYSSGTGGQGTSDLTVVVENMRTFRVLRSLKMVSRFQKVRLIVMAVTKAFQAMIFITVLLFIFAYIFAIIGVICFDYSKATKKLYYPTSFSSIVNALITLFQLFTLDHWVDVYRDLTHVMGEGIAAMYVIFWIVIGSFIFRNIFVGIMVNNFQSIRNDLFEEVVELKERERREDQMIEFANELANADSETRMDDGSKSSVKDDKNQSSKKGASASAARRLSTLEEEESKTGMSSSSRFDSIHELKEVVSNHVHNAEKVSAEWQKTVLENLENLAKEEATFCWPRDSLFRYFLMMEALQENLQERQELMRLSMEALLHVHDT